MTTIVYALIYVFRRTQRFVTYTAAAVAKGSPSPLDLETAIAGSKNSWAIP